MQGYPQPIRTQRFVHGVLDHHREPIGHHLAGGGVACKNLYPLLDLPLIGGHLLQSGSQAGEVLTQGANFLTKLSVVGLGQVQRSQQLGSHGLQVRPLTRSGGERLNLRQSTVVADEGQGGLDRGDLTSVNGFQGQAQAVQSFACEQASSPYISIQHAEDDFITSSGPPKGCAGDTQFGSSLPGREDEFGHAAQLSGG